MKVQHIGNNIKNVREEKGMTQADLAKALKLSLKTIGQIEQAEYISRTAIERIAQALDVPVEKILNYGS